MTTDQPYCLVCGLDAEEADDCPFNLEENDDLLDEWEEDHCLALLLEERSS